MARPLALAAGLALLLACKLDPGGRCTFDSQCSAGLACSGGMCVVRSAGADLGASCAVDTDCVSWGECRANVCMLAPGACAANGDCPSWQACGTNHKCANAAGKCGSNADCVSWKSCSLSSYTCGLLPNRCDTASNCKAWQTCDGTNTCVTAAGYCDATNQVTQCAAWQKCDLTGAAATHTCLTRAGYCATTADCGPFRTCQSNLCVSSDGTDVLLIGDLLAGDGTTAALALLGDPKTPVVGFPAGFSPPRLDARGGVIYVDHRTSGVTATDVLVRVVPDAPAWDPVASTWHYPATPSANDVVVPTPNCTAGVIQHWIVRAGTGEVFHSCDPTVWYDVTGAARFTEPTGASLVAWSAGDAKLVVASGTWSVVDAAGAVHAVAGLPATFTFYAAHTSATGFWIALLDAGTASDELWAIDATGAATLVGAYPALAGGIVALDDSGRAYTSAGGQVLRRTAGAAAAEPALYTAAGGASVWTTNPASWWVSAAGPVLVTGP